MISPAVYKKRLEMLRRGRRLAYPIFVLGLIMFVVALVEVRGSGQQFLSILGIVVASFGLEFFVGRSISIHMFKNKYAASDVPISPEHSTPISDASARNRPVQWWRHLAGVGYSASPISALGGVLLIGSGEEKGYGFFFLLVGMVGAAHWLIVGRHAFRMRGR